MSNPSVTAYDQFCQFSVRSVTAEPLKVKDFVFSLHIFNVPKRSIIYILTPYVWFRFQSSLKFHDFMVHYVNDSMTPLVSQ